MYIGFCKTSNELVKHPYWNGTGGYYCSCCGPAPRHRKRYRRLVRRIIRQKDHKEFKAIIGDINARQATV
jgi:hypothetical protein